MKHEKLYAELMNKIRKSIFYTHERELGASHMFELVMPVFEARVKKTVEVLRDMDRMNDAEIDHLKAGNQVSELSLQCNKLDIKDTIQTLLKG